MKDLRLIAMFLFLWDCRMGHAMDELVMRKDVIVMRSIALLFFHCVFRSIHLVLDEEAGLPHWHKLDTTRCVALHSLYDISANSAITRAHNLCAIHLNATSIHSATERVVVAVP